MISQSNHSVLRRLATASLYLATLAAAFPPSAVLGQTVHLVVAADTTEASGLGGDVIADKAGIRQLFESHIPSGQLRVKTIETANLTPDGILNTVGELQVEHPRRRGVLLHRARGLRRQSRTFLQLARQQGTVVQPSGAGDHPEGASHGGDHHGLLCRRGPVPRALKPYRMQVKVAQVSPLFQHLSGPRGHGQHHLVQAGRDLADPRRR